MKPLARDAILLCLSMRDALSISDIQQMSSDSYSRSALNAARQDLSDGGYIISAGIGPSSNARGKKMVQLFALALTPPKPVAKTVACTDRIGIAERAIAARPELQRVWG